MTIHPLSPLTIAEIEQGAALVAAQLGDDACVLGACAWAKQEITRPNPT